MQPAVCDFDREVATSWGRTANGAKPSENIVQDETEDPELDKAEAELKRQYAEVGQDVEFSELQIQTSNIKVGPEAHDVVPMYAMQLLCPSQHLPFLSWCSIAGVVHISEQRGGDD